MRKSQRKLPRVPLPFDGSFPVTLAFGSAPPNAQIAQQFRAWGVVGHHGIDFGLPSGTRVRAVGAGRVIHAGPLDDFGISIIIRHAWGESLYAHLSRTHVTQVL